MYIALDWPMRIRGHHRHEQHLPPISEHVYGRNGVKQPFNLSLNTGCRQTRSGFGQPDGDNEYIPRTDPLILLYDVDQ